jgi:hypothetical protein
MRLNLCSIKATAFVLLLATFSYIFAALKAPACIHLKMEKDSLALLQPTVLTVQLTNNLNSTLFLKDHVTIYGPSRHLQWPLDLTLTLVTPGGDEYPCRVNPSPSGPPAYAALPAKDSLCAHSFLNWSEVLTKTCEANLAKIVTPGNYKIFASYELPPQEILHLSPESLAVLYLLYYAGKELPMPEGNLVYSDTVEFVFLPQNETYPRRIGKVSSLGKAFAPDWEWNESQAQCRLELLRDSNTPYSEAARYMLLGRIWCRDSLMSQRVCFASLYPGSWLELLWLQEELVRLTVASFYGMRAPQAVDSILAAHPEMAANNYFVRRARGELKLLPHSW